jgi:4-carboxymuconolactone decarboxylase
MTRPDSSAAGVRVEKERAAMAENTAGGWTGGQNAFGDFAPGMVHYTDKILFDEVWEREGLSKRDRSLITVAALVAAGKMDQLRFHLDFARQNGVAEEELKEAITHIAFYAGWPHGMGAMTVAKEVFAGGEG